MGEPLTDYIKTAKNTNIIEIKKESKLLTFHYSLLTFTFHFHYSLLTKLKLNNYETFQLGVLLFLLLGFNSARADRVKM